MAIDPEKIFLASPAFEAAVGGVAEALSHRGYTADDDTIQSVAVSVLVRFVGADGLTEEGVERLTAMILSVYNRLQGHFDLDAIH
ncbi:hypothetical protein [Methylobacterium sp. J-067]|uniref:hypothetical protein n=1 Tax=Methylobacterium sp. J-067 TaxID=2836648 RepID=UPI001FBB5D58|nr:hypothetical protein [Methylobacterium sp. J-067]MCJ2025106.1 hypothetical protein [Methylobacterium sp. J-067]